MMETGLDGIDINELVSPNTTSKITFCKVFPWILSIIFLLTSIIFMILYIKKETPAKEETFTIIDQSHFIPILDSVDADPKKGANYYTGKYDILNTIYYPHIDYYNLKNSETRVILEHFKTYQQTSEYTCGCSCLVMSLYYLGKTDMKEKECSFKTNTSSSHGVLPSELKSLIIEYGFDYESNSNLTENGNPINDGFQFEEYVIDAINNKEPVIVLSADWGGHYLTIIGVDKIGKDINNHVFIVADPYDTTDHIQDGYNIWGVERLYSSMLIPIEIIYDPEQRVFEFIRVKRKK